MVGADPRVSVLQQSVVQAHRKYHIEYGPRLSNHVMHGLITLFLLGGTLSSNFLSMINPIYSYNSLGETNSRLGRKILTTRSHWIPIRASPGDRPRRHHHYEQFYRLSWKKKVSELHRGCDGLADLIIAEIIESYFIFASPKSRPTESLKQ